MQLSEAIRIGSQLRGESHDGPFVRIANTEELRSDAWGAACEAVHSPIAKRRWDRSDKLSYSSDIEALREIQQKYFAWTFNATAYCPGARARGFTEAGVKFLDRHGLYQRKGEEQKSFGAITSDCSRVINLAEFIEHAFYAHNWTREECAQAAEWYEQRSSILIVQNFDHFRAPIIEQRMNHRLTVAMRQRERERHQRRANRRVYFTN